MILVGCHWQRNLKNKVLKELKLINSIDLWSLHHPFPFSGREMDTEKCIRGLLCPTIKIAKCLDQPL